MQRVISIVFAIVGVDLFDYTLKDARSLLNADRFHGAACYLANDFFGSRAMPQCNARLTILRVIAGRAGAEYWALQCTSCHGVHLDIVEPPTRH